MNARSFFCLMVLLLSVKANACSVCMGSSESLTASAANGAIFLMLGFIGTILIGIAGFVFYLAKRSGTAAAIAIHKVSIAGGTKHA